MHSISPPPMAKSMRASLRCAREPVMRYDLYSPKAGPSRNPGHMYCISCQPNTSHSINIMPYVISTPLAMGEPPSARRELPLDSPNHISSSGHSDINDSFIWKRPPHNQYAGAS